MKNTPPKDRVHRTTLETRRHLQTSVQRRTIKHIYGTPPASRIYFDGLVAYLQKHKYEHADADPSILLRHSSQVTIIIAVGMDDFLLIATNKTLIDEIFKELHRKYKIKGLGFPHQYLSHTADAMDKKHA